MKKVVLKRIQLTNWKSLNLDVEFSESKTKISGANGIGKSSLQNAWNWLLSGYTNAYSPKNHELFDNKVEITHETPIASVKAWVSINGIEYTVEKTAQAKFTRRRGTNEYIKDSSDTYKMLIDEIETTATDFNSWIEQNICPTDMLVHCLDGNFFAVIADDDKKKARKVLETIVGEIKPEDFTGDYDVLANDFAKGYTIEQIEERTKNRIKPVKDRMSDIPTLVADKERTLAEYQQIDYADLEQQIENKKKEIEEIDNQMLGKAESIRPIIAQRDAILSEINSKTLKLSEQRNAYTAKQNAIVDEIKGRLDDIDRRNRQIQQRNDEKNRDLKNAEASIQRLKTELKSHEQLRADLLAQRDEIKGRVFVEDKCGYCGQELPDDMVEKAKQQFNQRKQNELDSIIVRGKNCRANIEDCQDKIKALEETISNGIELEQLEDRNALAKEVDDAIRKSIPYTETDEYKKATEEIEGLKASLPEIPQTDNDTLTQAKKTLIDAIGTLNQTYGYKHKADALKAEISDLKAELRKVANELAQLEGVLAKCAEYREEKANIISMRVNNKLDDCKIQMWERQKNGEMIPSCIITDNSGVKYSTLNNSNRIKTCVSIQQLFCRHFGIKMPVWVDEASIFSAFNQPNPDSQSIYLYATDIKQLSVDKC